MNWSALLLECAVALLALTVLLVDLWLPATRKYYLGWLTLAGLGAIFLVSVGRTGVHGQTFGGLLVADELAHYFHGLFLATAILVTLMAQHTLQRIARGQGEFYLLLLSALLGMLVLAAVNDFVLLFVGLELLTFSMYVMTAYLRTDPRSIEAGLKYLILGSISSGFLVYGISYLYGMTGSTRFDVLRHLVAAGPPGPGVLFGFLLVLSGLGFKIASVPFHLWVPDVYEGAPTPVAAYLSVGSKAAGLVVLLRFVLGVFGTASAMWIGVIAALSAMTMCYGNLAAIPQTNIKRLLGYSSIGQVGYLLMGIAAASAPGAAAIAYYLLAYLFTNLCLFLVVVIVGRQAHGDGLEHYAGLARRSPLLGCALFVALLSLAGVPPLAGFFGKFLLLLATVKSGLFWLAVVGGINVVISLYYYLLVIKRVFLHPAATNAPVPISLSMRLALYACLAGILVVGLWPQPFLHWATAAVRPLF